MKGDGGDGVRRDNRVSLIFRGFRVSALRALPRSLPTIDAKVLGHFRSKHRRMTVAAGGYRPTPQTDTPANQAGLNPHATAQSAIKAWRLAN